MSTIVKTKFPNRYDVVGSLLRPARLKQARADFQAHKFSEAELHHVEDEEIKRIVKKQVELGLKDVTDGEFRRSWWHLDFYDGLNGAEFFTPAHGYNFNGEETRRGGIKITDKITYNPDHPFFAGFEYLQSIVPDGVTAKQTIPSPSVFFPSDDAKIVDTHYHNLDAFVADVVLAYQKTIQHFYDLGCRYLQIDDTSWGMWASFSEGTLNPDLVPLAEAAVRAINAIADNKPEDLTLTMHVCRGNYDSTWAGAGAYDPVAEYLAQLHIDGYFLEYDDARSGGFEPLAKIAANGLNHQRVVLGLVTSKKPALEAQTQLIARIHEAAKYIPLEQLCLSSQCGFASTEEGNRLTEADQWRKLQLVVNTAKAVWDI
ncbi:5-methyltetrahydropteroyltriglutamate--homocysteine S-methyltransferase [Agrilactobacillus fermenti]|uniref:5-methyltetrahydropteroyltriglutamate-- homocysteine S-methyltransferase n=1 Tax=Agrilactobacillus fermenti TaxID=2586909 RepID=UPI001E5FE531|nr:5-methyltetrahydropteroyltriglutamate--homocysteine S-methyltransferase [Agrilactobacillus fermenti]MCD2257192.1 5-methyltetrahydropteroyltriglutamate--homocysteine S-methyltransferase [Agrilactobacillus fermenti]